MTSWNTSHGGLAAPGLEFGHGAGPMADLAGPGDAVDTYFECISTCSLDDAECITVCTMVLRENN
jgi:hypothetical protein